MFIQVIITLVLWMVDKIYQSKHRSKVEPIIVAYFSDMVTNNGNAHAPTVMELYRGVVQENLKISAKILKVKKGRRRYDMVLFETPKGVLKFRLKRHGAFTEVYENSLN